jgi:FtsP/CotA-like multicopper oxidase with cupredoxin domain/plastocyanin
MRGLKAFLAGVLVGVLATWALSGGWAALLSRTWPPPHGIPTAMAPGGQIREFHLEAKPAKWEITPGIVTDSWTYNGQVPGPELRVREGDLVRVIVTNHLPVPTTIHWHGVELNYKMDGVPGVSQDAIKPGERFTYEFIAYPAGTRMYHSHQDTTSQLELGLYGALIIEPRNGPRYDVDRTIILRERALDFTPEVALGQRELRGADAGNGRGGALQYDLFLMDGKAGSAIPPVRVKSNQRVLLRLINLGHLVHAIHLHGHTFTIVATDGNPVPPGGRLRKDTVTIGPGERYDVEVEATNPGVWMLHCHMPNHGENGMMTLMEYEGFAAVGQHVHIQPRPVRAGAATTPPGTTGVGGAPSAAPGAAVSGRSAGTGRTVTIPMVDNRFLADGLEVPVGTRVVWENRGQNIHTSTSLDGLWDSPGVQRKGTFAFIFTKPGEYRFLCREHLLQGMTGTITVR